MNKFALTTIAALPGQGGGAVAALRVEVNKPAIPPAPKPIPANIKPVPILKRSKLLDIVSMAEEEDSLRTILKREKFAEIYDSYPSKVRKQMKSAFEAKYGQDLGFIREDDPYRAVKIAAMQGRKIEVRFGFDDNWVEWKSSRAPAWTSGPECYRVKE